MPLKYTCSIQKSDHIRCTYFRPTLSLGLAWTLKIWSTMIAWFHQMWPRVGLKHSLIPCGVLGDIILVTNFRASLKESGWAITHGLDWAHLLDNKYLRCQFMKGYSLSLHFLPRTLGLASSFYTWQSWIHFFLIKLDWIWGLNAHELGWCSCQLQVVYKVGFRPTMSLFRNHFKHTCLSTTITSLAKVPTQDWTSHVSWL